MIKVLRFFVLVLAFFYQILFFFVTQWHRVIKIVDALICTPHKYQNVYCAVSSNDQYQGNGFTVEALVGCDHRSFVPTSPSVVQHFPTWRLSAILNFNIFFIFDHVTVIDVLICRGVPNFIKIGSRVCLPDARNC